MQRVGAHEILRHLGDSAVLCGQKLGAYGRIEDIQQHGAKGLALGLLRLMRHQVAYQRFGHACIHAVHAHVVAIVGGPTQRQLGKIARAHHQAPFHIGDIHQHLGALTGLGVFIGHVVYIRILADIPEMLLHGLADIHAAEGDAQCLAKRLGVIARSIRGTKAGHGHGQGILGASSEQRQRPCHHQQGQAGIQPAGNADYQLFRPNMGRALG